MRNPLFYILKQELKKLITTDGKNVEFCINEFNNRSKNIENGIT